jgi:hypothetical protein
MKKVVLWTIILLFIATDIIYENHRNVEEQWGLVYNDWKKQEISWGSDDCC